MSEKENELREEIENQQENEHQIDEPGNGNGDNGDNGNGGDHDIAGISYEKSISNTTRMQAPDQWPDPPQENEESSDEE